MIYIVVKIDNWPFENKCFVLYHTIWAKIISSYMFFSICNQVPFDIHYLFWSLYILSSLLSFSKWVLRIFLGLIYLFFYISYHSHYYFRIGIVYLPWLCISTLTLSRYFHLYFFLLIKYYKFGIFIQILQYLFNHIAFAIVLS